MRYFCCSGKLLLYSLHVFSTLPVEGDENMDVAALPLCSGESVCVCPVREKQKVQKLPCKKMYKIV